MKAMRLEAVGRPLVGRELPDPRAGRLEVRLRVEACAVCRTDLHVVDGDLPPRLAAVTPGHEIVGIVDQVGPDVSSFTVGMRVGVGWLGGVCFQCRYCRSGQENLCDAPHFTGYTRDGGFATQVLADARFAYPVPEGPGASDLAPLLCAGVIGWRALNFAREAKVLGLYGFGAAAHIIAQAAVWQGQRVFAFTRPGDLEAQALAREFGAEWAGNSLEPPPEPMDAAIIFAPAGELVPLALRQVRRGGRVVCAGIHMSDIPSFPYRDLWGERQIISVANLTRRDAHAFLGLASKIGIRMRTAVYPLIEANRALDDLRAGRVQGAAVLVP